MVTESLNNDSNLAAICMAFSKMGFGVGEGGKAAFSHPNFLFAPALGRGLGGGEKQGFRL